MKVTAPVTGTAATGERVRGVFVPRSFEETADGLVAKGVLTGRVRDGADVTAFRKRVTMTVQAVDGHAVTPTNARSAAAAFPPAPAPGACNVLNLVLAPLDLNVLGLQVHLDQVVLDVVAQSGAGQLLGNLLCFVAGLLDGGGPLAGLLTQPAGPAQRRSSVRWAACAPDPAYDARAAGRWARVHRPRSVPGLPRPCRAGRAAV